MSPNVDPQMAEKITRRLNISIVDDLGEYLGVPLFHGRMKKSIYTKLKAKVVARGQRRNPARISLSRRTTLCKSTLSSMSFDTVQTSLFPKGMCSDFDKVLRGFFWGPFEQQGN
ncbi:hypothetical protein Syun_006171 [Stephania yunnanensis]|uniref:Uncharacterized protein n=1 Tax=Stephania yunnanensis TaxID=152371 RepID=A0AAP0KX53_9MAGN